MFIKIGTKYINPSAIKIIKVKGNKIVACDGKYFDPDSYESEEIAYVILELEPGEVDTQAALDKFMLKLEKQIIAQEKFLRSLYEKEET